MEDEINNNKKVKGKFLIKYLIFVLILAILTLAALFATIQYRKKIKQNEEIRKDVFSTEKKETDEKNLTVSSYSETYNENPIRITTYYDADGKLYTEYHDSKVQFVQISGLIDQEIEAKINYELKETAYSLEHENGYVVSQVMGNFANILSVDYDITYTDGDKDIYKCKTLNIDLNTGEKIPFEKVFISSAPIKSLLVDGLFEQLSWIEQAKKINEGEPAFEFDMDNADTSEYEEKALLLAKKYEKLKGNIQYCITPREILIYNLIDKSVLGIIDNSSEYIYRMSIDLAKNKDEIAIYKRYLGNDIYANNNIGMKNLVVFTEGYLDSFESINYGKITDNIFLEEAVYYYNEDSYNYAKKFIEEKSQELQDKIKGEISENEGMIYQRFYDVSEYNDTDYIWVSVRTGKAISSKEYFKENIFKDYIHLKSLSRADIGINSFNEYQKDVFPNLKIIEEDQENYFLDKSGNVVATSWEELNSLVNN